MPVVITKLYEGDSTGGAWATAFGSPSFTLAGGETLLVFETAFSTAQIPVPTDSLGTIAFVAAAQNAFNGSSLTQSGIATLYNATAGTHVITQPTIASGSDGELIIAKATGMPAVGNVRTAVKNQQVSGSTTFTLTTNSTPRAGDLAVALRLHENSVGFANAAQTNPPSGWTSLAIRNDAITNLSYQVSYMIVPADGAISATWTTADTGVTDTSGAILVLVPLPDATVTLMGQACL